MNLETIASNCGLGLEDGYSATCTHGAGARYTKCADHALVEGILNALVKDNGEEKYFKKPPDEKGAEIC